MPPNDLRISEVGPDGSAGYGAYAPAVVYNGQFDEYLVVWYGTDDSGGLDPSEFEIFGQRLLTDGTQIGLNDFQISDMAGTGELSYFAGNPAVAYVQPEGEYMVTWYADDDRGGMVDEEFEIFGQRLTAQGATLGFDDFRISFMAGSGDADFGAAFPALAFDSLGRRYFVVWQADHDADGQVDGELEIFGARVFPPLFEDDFERGTSSAWSSTTP